MAAPDTTLPGVYSAFQPAKGTFIAPSPGKVVAVAIRHNWGPIAAPQLFTAFDKWEAVFGTDVTTGRAVVDGAFRGEGLPGAGGASGVVVGRLAGAAAAFAAVTLNAATGGTPSLKLQGLYKGTRANRLSAQVSPIAGGVQTISILDGTTPIATYTYTIAAAPAMAGIVAQIAADAKSLITGSVTAETTTGLAAGTFPLVGGNDGTVLTGTDWVNGTEPFNDFDFAFFAPDDLPWAQDAGSQSIRDAITTLQSWRTDQEAQGHRFTLVVGGKLDEAPADAIARATALADPGVITVGGPGFNDDTYGALSSSQFASRFAGIRAQRGEGQSADMARVAGGTPRPQSTGTRLLLSDVESMVAAGVVVLTRDRYAAAPTRIAADVNTYQPNVADPETQPADRPRAVWGTPKYVLSMQQFANDAEQALALAMIGRTIVNDSTRNAGAARVLSMAKDREGTAFDPGTVVLPVPGEDTDNFIRLAVTLVFGRALAKLFIENTVR